ncbi:hypothetical protein QOZ80_6AG0529280 [Eleusine coracana subsp. coracana]|nr:hypothetical protein QOZ80_6AG0529280 [Eleusine coracana subsp. coracana]
MDDGVDCGDCAFICCLACCEACAEDSSNNRPPLPCACILLWLAVLALVAVLVAAFAFVLPVCVSVEEASLARLDLCATAPGTNNGTGAASLSYDVSLGVALRNPNWAMRAWRTGPLDLELRFHGGIPFARPRLADAGRDRIRPWRSGAAGRRSSPGSAPSACSTSSSSSTARLSTRRTPTGAASRRPAH